MQTEIANITLASVVGGRWVEASATTAALAKLNGKPVRSLGVFQNVLGQVFEKEAVWKPSLLDRLRGINLTPPR